MRHSSQPKALGVTETIPSRCVHLIFIFGPCLPPLQSELRRISRSHAGCCDAIVTYPPGAIITIAHYLFTQGAGTATMRNASSEGAAPTNPASAVRSPDAPKRSIEPQFSGLARLAATACEAPLAAIE